MPTIMTSYSQPFIFFSIYNCPNKLECYIKQGWQHLLVTNTHAYGAHSQVKKKMKGCEYGPWFIKIIKTNLIWI